MGACGQPGCTGTIEDGYCGVCGMAARFVPVAPAPLAGDGAVRAAGPAARPDGTGGSGRSSRSTSGRTASGRRSSRTGSTGASRRGSLGLGLIEIPPVPYRDPASAIMADPQVPESKRFCSSCGELVGQGSGGLPGRTEGFCRRCGTHFSFTPKLVAGDLVGGQYEVLGCLAHGGLGWIYLARDRNVSDRWVVLKGLLDTGDADAMAAAMAERRFLATVEHPNIVRIYNFVEHGGCGYIVMEHVGGRSLKEILLDHRRLHEGTSLPLPQVIAYGLESLRALGYLHGQGLVYCDFKPDNVIQTEEQLRLIDLGGVRRLDDEDGPIYGTVGYQAPEIAESGPTPASDLYTVSRAMAVLAFDFKGYTGRYRHALPDRDQVPLLQRQESFDRLLRRATHPDPDRRFWSAQEMAEQLTGVLREVLSAEDRKPRSAPSTLFGPELNAALTDVGEPLTPQAAVAALPSPLVATTDPAHGYLAGLAGAEPARLTALLAAAPVASTEVELRRARAYLDNDETGHALDVLRELEADGTLTGDWRLEWHQALAAVATGEIAEAIALFDDLYGLLPGEAAPRLGLALCLELDGDLRGAAYHHEAIWRTDHTFVSAAYGLARALLARGERAGAVGVLDSVPAGSSYRLTAQRTSVALLIRGRPAAELTRDVLLDAGARFESQGLDGEAGERLAIEILEAALAALPVIGATGPALPKADSRLLGSALTERGLRQRLEQAYRRLARLADSAAQRVAYVDRANFVRSKTLI